MGKADGREPVSFFSSFFLLPPAGKAQLPGNVGTTAFLSPSPSLFFFGSFLFFFFPVHEGKELRKKEQKPGFSFPSFFGSPLRLLFFFFFLLRLFPCAYIPPT